MHVQQLFSMISSIKTRVAGYEAPHSNRANEQRRRGKRKRHALSNYKGVIPQPNGNWGAQIYTGRSRVWLGTFRSENEAAAAYDSAFILLRPNDKQQRNLPCVLRHSQEQSFQKQFTKKAILCMIKEGSYETMFDDYLMEGGLSPEDDPPNTTGLVVVTSSSDRPTHAAAGTSSHTAGSGSGSGSGSGGVVRFVKLFQKDLKPSDVSKLNRLVIPKKHALRYFPHVHNLEPDQQLEARQGGGDAGRGVELVFSCGSRNQLWKFRYCYWASSQSYVFTRGWKRFVKEKQLKPNDVVTFYRCEAREGHSKDEVRVFFVIDVNYMGAALPPPPSDTDVALPPEAIDDHQPTTPLLMNIQQHPSATAHHHGQLVNKIPSAEITPIHHHHQAQDASLNKGFRLFGVHISPPT